MELYEFFKDHPEAAAAFSGGADSTYLLYAAGRYAEKVEAYYISSAFQPERERDEALRIAGSLGIPVKTIRMDVMADERIVSNPIDRCYYCKRLMFTAIREQAEKDGFDIVIDGTNASDDAGDRPGMRALRELSVLSPLRMCGMSKSGIRELSKEAGLITWNKPANACLATRIPFGERITEEKLRAAEAAEDHMIALGFSDFRVRRIGDAAKIQVTEAQLEKAIEDRELIIKELKQYFSSVLLDLEVRS